MDEFDRVRLLLRMDTLKALLVVSEMERAALNFEIGSPQITPERKSEAITRRDAVVIEWGRRMTELHELETSTYFRD